MAELDTFGRALFRSSVLTWAISLPLKINKHMRGDNGTLVWIQLALFPFVSRL